MKLRSLLEWSSTLCLSAAIVQAQETNDIEKSNRQLQQMQENFERRLREQQAQIDALKKQLETNKTNATPTGPQPPPPPSAGTSEQKNVPAATPAPPPTALADQPWTPASPLRIGSAQNYINLSVDALVAGGWSTARDIESLQQGDHDPHQRGFTLQNLETVFDGKVDPYFRGQANVVLKIDAAGETTIEAEEAYLETMALPWNLQVKAGQFFSEFGRINPTHPHTWDFVDAPLVLNRFMGGDGLRNPGARLSWLTPTPFYSELFFAVQNSQGETAHSFRNDNESEPFFGRTVEQGRVKSPGDLLFTPRYTASFNLSDSQTLLAGASAAFGPNGAGGDTQIYGVDLFWKWKPVNHHAGFPFVSWQTEGMLRQFEAGSFGGDAGANPPIPPLPHETLTDYGLYSQVAYGIRKGWVAALRGDYLFPEKRGSYESIVGADPERASRWRVSPNLTYYPSEFSKIRLQYNYDHRNGLGDDHSVWVQFEFLLGAHAAHKF